MKRGLGAALAATVAASCVILERDPLDQVSDPGKPDASGRGDGSVEFGDGSVTNEVPIPGSGLDGDNGTAVLALVRIDQGTANIADSVQNLLSLVIDRLGPQGLKVTSVAVGDLYRPQFFWASRENGPTPPSLAAVLRAVATASPGTETLPCTTSSLQTFGSSLLSTMVNGVNPFFPPPGALLVVLIDSGARPSPLTGCTSAGYWAADPVRWLSFGPGIRRGRTHFVFLATPENNDLSGMRARCIGVSGFPVSALDVLAPSANTYFDPLSTQMNGLAPGLTNRADLCDAFGDGAGAFWTDVAGRWFPMLAGSR